MDDLIDMMVTNQSPAEVSDKIKEILMKKAAENIDIVRPVVAASMFGEPETESQSEVENTQEYEETEGEDAE